MTKDEKLRIIELREKGYGYKAISKELGLSLGSVRHFISNGCSIEGLNSNKCKCCGKQLIQIPKKKRRIFCSNECKTKWWNKHHEEITKKTMHEFVCPTCGISFQVYGIKNRKYCSLGCYWQAKNKRGDSND